MILARTALAAEIVSFWICKRVVLFDLRSVTGLPNDVGGGLVGEAAICEDEEGAGVDDEEDEDEDGRTALGSDVIRSISVIPEESWKEKKKE